MFASVEGLSSERQLTARQYGRKTRLLFLMEAGISLCLLAVVAFSPLRLPFGHLDAFPRPAAVLVAVSLFLTMYHVALSPFTVYGGFLLPRRYGLLTQRWPGWLLDRLKGLALQIGVGTSLLLAIYAMISHYPEAWWVLAGLMVFIITVLLTYLAPVTILPLLARMRRLDDGELAGRLTLLAEKAGVTALGVYVADFGGKSTVANAALAGLGKTQRIVLTATLLKAPADEIEAVLAHELAHHRHRDIWRLMTVQSLAALAGFYLLALSSGAVVPIAGYADLSDLVALPWIALFASAYVLVLAPLLNGYRRGLERAADRHALRMTGGIRPFLDAMARLTDQNLSEAQPPRWAELLFYDHPPYCQRADDALHQVAALRQKENDC